MTTVPDSVFARNIRLVREASKMSRRELAAAAGISQSYVEKLELRYLRPSEATVRALALALRVSVRYLGQRLAAPSRPVRPRDAAMAKVIRRTRVELGLDREQLARRTGISVAFLLDLEMGRRMPSAATRRSLATALRVSEKKLAAVASKRRRFRIGSVVEELRRRAGLSRTKLAKGARVAENYLAAIERGLAEPSAETIRDLAATLRVSPVALRASLQRPVRHRTGPRSARERAR